VHWEYLKNNKKKKNKHPLNERPTRPNWSEMIQNHIFKNYRRIHAYQRNHGTSEVEEWMGLASSIDRMKLPQLPMLVQCLLSLLLLNG
jgi:hypothetical protein